MDGAKQITDTEDNIAMFMVDRRLVRAKASLRGGVNRSRMRILVVVGPEYGEKPYRVKGKGSLTMLISQGVLDPNRPRNVDDGKGKQVNIPVVSLYVRQRKLNF